MMLSVNCISKWIQVGVSPSLRYTRIVTRDVMALYVDRRGDLNAQSKHGETALHQAGSQCELETLV